MALTYHDLESILEIAPDGEMICVCPRHGKRRIPVGLAKRLKPLMRGRTRCKTGEIVVPEDFWVESSYPVVESMAQPKLRWPSAPGHVGRKTVTRSNSKTLSPHLQ